MKRETLRPLVHAAVLGFVFLAPVLGTWGMAGAAFAAALVNAFLLPATALGKALRREGEPRLGGLVTYPLAVALGYALFPPVLASTAWTVMALGDPAAALVGGGRDWKARIPWNRRKSAAGSLAFLLAAWVGVLGVLCASRFLDGRPTEASPCLAIGGATALIGAAVESLPIPWDDNLPVVLAVGGAMTWAIPMFA